MTAPLLELEGVTRRFVKQLDVAERLGRLLGAPVNEEVVHAVTGVDLAIEPGEVFGIVGESGCGKSTLGRMVAGIDKPTSGVIRYRGHDMAALRGDDARRAKLAVQMIFQDPFASLNPRMSVEEIIGEAPIFHGLVRRHEAGEYVASLMEKVGLDPVYRRRYPHQFSGGQRQRIGIARALAVKPEFIVCDEAVSALDVSIQAQVINLFMELRKEFNLTYLFISHDLSVIEHVSDRVGVMYLGRVVESAPIESLFAKPNHPYTRALLEAVPRLANRHQKFQPVKGEIPSPFDPPPGCHFHPRCPFAFSRCRSEAPGLRALSPDHLSACHLND